jgi:hypothetical protein
MVVAVPSRVAGADEPLLDGRSRTGRGADALDAVVISRWWR